MPSVTVRRELVVKKMDDIILTPDDLDHIDSILETGLKKSGAHTVMLVDKAGQIVSYQGSMEEWKRLHLAALSVADYGSATAIANLFGEKEFTVCFRKGKGENVNFSSFGEDCVLITVFNNSTNLGIVRMEMQKVLEQLEKIFGK